ncbi:MAG: hypothetical protein ABF335_13170 [Alphaproteobacteria bacterium]
MSLTDKHTSIISKYRVTYECIDSGNNQIGYQTTTIKAASEDRIPDAISDYCATHNIYDATIASVIKLPQDTQYLVVGFIL